jgi:hypothetical protein
MPRVTIVPADSLVIVDGRGLHVDCSCVAAGIHAIQWDGRAGAIERHGEPNETLDLAGYANHVAPLYTAWESARAAADAPPPPPTLEQAKAAKLATIHSEKNRARDGGFMVGGVLYDSDLPARTSYAELAIAMQTDPDLTTRWKASDGVWVDMTSALFGQVYAAGRAHIEACFAWQEAREREVAAATTVAAVDAISATYVVTP